MRELKLMLAEIKESFGFKDGVVGTGCSTLGEPFCVFGVYFAPAKESATSFTCLTCPTAAAARRTLPLPYADGAQGWTSSLITLRINNC